MDRLVLSIMTRSYVFQRENVLKLLSVLLLSLLLCVPLFSLTHPSLDNATQNRSRRPAYYHYNDTQYIHSVV
jgi:hypothetical protein